MPASSSLQRRFSSLPRQHPPGSSGAIGKDPGEEWRVSRAHHTAACSLVGLTPPPPRSTPHLPASTPANSLQGQLETWGGLPHPHGAPSLLFPAAPQAFFTHNPMSFPISPNIPFLMRACNNFFFSSHMQARVLLPPVTAMLIPLRLPFPPAWSHRKLTPGISLCRGQPAFP